MTPMDQEVSEGRYELNGGTFRGWLGLTNDVSGRARLLWATGDRFELIYPDGTVASFRRQQGPAAMPGQPRFRCVPVTIRGVDYDLRRVARAKKLLDDLVPSPPPQELLGTWSDTQEVGGRHTSRRLTFGRDGVVESCTLTEEQYSPARTYRSKATYTVWKGHLVSELFACGDPVPFRVEPSRLVLQASGRIAFRRQSREGGAVENCR